MCDPLTIAGIALTAGSTLANSIANNQVSGARTAALSAERERQNAFDAEAQTLNTQSQDRYQDFGGQQGASASTLADFYRGQTTGVPAPASAPPASTSAIAVREEDKQRGAARDFTNQQADALGQLRSFGDVLGGISRGQGRDAMQIGTIGGLKRGSAGIVPFELDAAAEAGDGMRFLGDLLAGAGNISTGAGLSGGNLFTSALPGNTIGAGTNAAEMASLAAGTYRPPTRLNLPALYGAA